MSCLPVSKLKTPRTHPDFQGSAEMSVNKPLAQEPTSSCRCHAAAESQEQRERDTATESILLHWDMIFYTQATSLRWELNKLNKWPPAPWSWSSPNFSARRTTTASKTLHLREDHLNSPCCIWNLFLLSCTSAPGEFITPSCAATFHILAGISCFNKTSSFLYTCL